MRKLGWSLKENVYHSPIRLQKSPKIRLAKNYQVLFSIINTELVKPNYLSVCGFAIEKKTKQQFFLAISKQDVYLSGFFRIKYKGSKLC